MSGYKYFWTCPNCSTSLQLKMRVTQTTRKCPHCGFVVTPEEIDRQNLYSVIGVVILIVFIWVLCATPTGTVTNIFYGLVGLVVISFVAWVVYVGFFKVDLESISDESKAVLLAESTSDENKSAFIRSPDFHLVRNFAQSELVFEDGAQEKLHRLLQNKGWNFTSEELDAFVTEESDAHLTAEQSTWIANQIRAKSPQNRDAYLRAYLDVSYPHENEYLHVLATFLKVSELEYPKLRDELTSLSKNSDLDEFERRLRDGNDL